MMSTSPGRRPVLCARPVRPPRPLPRAPQPGAYPCAPSLWPRIPPPSFPPTSTRRPVSTPHPARYLVDPNDKWQGLEPNTQDCNGNPKVKFSGQGPLSCAKTGQTHTRCYGFPSKRDYNTRRAYVIHEGATAFRDPGVTVFDLNDGVMVDGGNCPMYKEGAACKPKTTPQQVCTIAIGEKGGSCGNTKKAEIDCHKPKADQIHCHYWAINEGAVGSQEVYYYAEDQVGKVMYKTRNVTVEDARPPVIKIRKDVRLGTCVFDMLVRGAKTNDAICPEYKQGMAPDPDLVQRMARTLAINDREGAKNFDEDGFPKQNNEICRCSPSTYPYQSEGDTALETIGWKHRTQESGLPADSRSKKEMACPSQASKNPPGRQPLCEILNHPVGIKYVDPGVTASDTIFPYRMHTTTLYPALKRTGGGVAFTKQIGTSGQTAEVAQALIDRSVRVHNPVNPYPSEGLRADATKNEMPQKYSVVYKAKDAVGNEAELVRDVNVQDIFQPVLKPIEREGEANSGVQLLLEGGQRFDDPFATADDPTDGDLTWAITRKVTRSNNLPQAGECCQELVENKLIARAEGKECEPQRTVDKKCCVLKKTGCDRSRPNVIDTRAPHGTEFTFTYTVKDRANNNVAPPAPGATAGPTAAAAIKEKKVRIVDTTPPILSLDGDSPYRQQRGEKFLRPQDPGSEITATAYDNVDDAEWITSQVRAYVVGGGTVDTSSKAFTQYVINYTCSDYNGNGAKEISRVILIVDAKKPTVTITAGSKAMTLKAGEKRWEEPGVTAQDGADGAYYYGPPLYASRARTSARLVNEDDCEAGKYQLRDCSGDTCVTNCLVIKEACKPNEYEVAAPTKTSDRKCTLKADCAAGLQLEVDSTVWKTNGDNQCCRCRGCARVMLPEVPSAQRDVMTAKLDQAKYTALPLCRPFLYEIEANFRDKYTVQEDVLPRQNNGVDVRVAVPDSQEGGVNDGIGLAVVGLDESFGRWAYHCCSKR